MNDNIIHLEPQEIGGETVRSLIEPGYEGPCAVMEDNVNDILICALPDYQEARMAAIFASTPDGGYGSTKIIRCAVNDITHEDFMTWAFFG